MTAIIGPFWTKRAKPDDGRDPLGLDRPSDRLTRELLPGFSVNVNLARYFTLFPWLFYTSQSDTAEALLDEIERAEKVFALGSYLMHGEKPCVTGIAGRDLVAEHWKDRQQYLLDRIRWFAGGGVYKGFYIGPMFKLGLLEAGAKGRVNVTRHGLPLALAFATSVGNAAWAQGGRGRQTVSRADVLQFAQFACPCTLAEHPAELAALRALFFELDNLEGKALSRSMTFILSLIDQAQPFELSNLEEPFRLAMYYRELYDGDGRVFPFNVMPALNSIVAGWRIFQAHDYFSFALESLFTVWLEAMAAHPAQQITLGEFLAEISPKAFAGALSDALGQTIPDVQLDQISVGSLVQGLLDAIHENTLTVASSAAFDSAVRLEHALCEQRLAATLVKRQEQGGQLAERCAGALVLLLTLYVRFHHYVRSAEHRHVWERYEAASSQSETDLALARFYWLFPLDQWAARSVHAFLENLIAQSIIQQTLAVAEDRGRQTIWFSETGLAGLGKIAPLTQVYHYQFAFDRTGLYRNTSKLNNALAVLANLGYATADDGYWVLTADGRERLQQMGEA